MADVRAWNRALTAAEVWQLYDPRTRWDLYYPLRQRTFFIPDTVQAGYPAGAHLFWPLTGF